jgi:glycosyltransferase involved in cell wall biosynthesis
MVLLKQKRATSAFQLIDTRTIGTALASKLVPARKQPMSDRLPLKVLITGGHETGGVSSFAEALCSGFADLGIDARVIAPGRVLGCLGELRDPRVLKILSLSAIFAAPLARRAICVAHGFPRADAQGWIKTLGIAGSFSVANRSSRLVAVSHYVATHLRAIFNLRVDAVIHNPLNHAFFNAASNHWRERDTIVFAGRLHPVKGLDRILPALLATVRESPCLRAVIAGDGVLRPMVEALVAQEPRIKLAGLLPHAELRRLLSRARVFVSGCETEALGISYLEALSQGCAVVMPACAGGLEIAPEEIGKAIHLFSGTGHEPMVNALRRALQSEPPGVDLRSYAPRAVAEAYLNLDARFFPVHMKLAVVPHA